MEKPKITVTKNGPYFLTGIQSLQTDLNDIPLKSKTFLCRCGNSWTKPHCDGSHAKTHFDGTCQKNCQRKKRAYVGNGITIYFDYTLCAHIGACVQGLPAVFASNRIPWIDATLGSVEQIIDVIKTCPSGALTYQIDNENEIIEWCEYSKVSVQNNGPYTVTNISLINKQDVQTCEYNEDHYLLCRCSKSLRKPFCDGSHKQGALFDKDIVK